MQHPSEVVTVAFSADGSRMVTACTDGFFRLWDTTTGQPVAKSEVHHEAWSTLHRWGGVRCVAFSPDGSRIVTGSHEGTAQLWDASTLKPIGKPLQHAPIGEPLKPKDRVRKVAFSPGGTRIVTGSGFRGEGAVRLWNAATLEAVGEPLQRWTAAFRFCPSGLLALSQRGHAFAQLLE